MTFTVRDAVRLYGIDTWGNGYFDVNPRGHLLVKPDGGEASVDLYSLVSRLKRKKMRFPVLLRFPQILASRVGQIFGSFDRAILCCAASLPVSRWGFSRRWARAPTSKTSCCMPGYCFVPTRCCRTRGCAW